MHFLLYQLDFMSLKPEVEQELQNDLRDKLKENSSLAAIAKDLAEKMAYEEFENSKHINICLMQYALDILDKEEKKAKKKKEKLMKETVKESTLRSVLMSPGSHMVLNLFIFGMLLAFWLYFRDDIFKYFYDNKKRGRM